MRRSMLAAAAVQILALAIPFGAMAEEITVEPGEGTLSAALAQAQPGDLVTLEAGDFFDAVSVPAGIQVRGAGADQTRLILAGDGSAIGLFIDGPGSSIGDLSVVGRLSASQRGLLSEHPVRIERARFSNLRVGVHLEVAPLSDVIACEFIDCRTGVQADITSSPTIWGCHFKRCQIGVFAAEGGPYIRNCLFQQSLIGIQHFVGAEKSMGIFRNNMFHQVSRNPMELQSRQPLPEAPSIRNTVVHHSGSFGNGTYQLFERTSHGLIWKCPEPLFRKSSEGEINILYSDRGMFVGIANIQVMDDGRVIVGNRALLARRGIRAGCDAPTAKGDVGIESGWRATGVNAGLNKPQPPVRFEEPVLVSNNELEERAHLERLGISVDEGGRVVDDDARTVDYVGTDANGEPVTITFDISRYWGEANLPVEWTL